MTRRSLLAAFLLLPLLGACGTPPATAPASADEFTIVTSFYPLYLMAKNIARDIPGVRVVNLTASATGCLHDYQLTPGDLQTLAAADVFVINGGGMEPFAARVRTQYPRLPVIDAGVSRRIRLPASPSDPALVIIVDTDGTRTVDPHQWASIGGARTQLALLTDSFCQLDPPHADAYRRNRDNYDQHLFALQAQTSSVFATSQQHGRNNYLILHGTLWWWALEHHALPSYFAIADPETGPTARESAAIIRRIRDEQAGILFVDTVIPPAAVAAIARETGVHVYTIDPCVTGPDDPDAYLKAMERNLATLKEALQ